MSNRTILQKEENEYSLTKNGKKILLTEEELINLYYMINDIILDNETLWIK